MQSDLIRKGAPLTSTSLYRFDQLGVFASCLETSGAVMESGSFTAPRNLPSCPYVLYLNRSAFILKSHAPRSECAMSIFYIIGVVVVVLIVAGFFGLHL